MHKRCDQDMRQGALPGPGVVWEQYLQQAASRYMGFQQVCVREFRKLLSPSVTSNYVLGSPGEVCAGT